MGGDRPQMDQIGDLFLGRGGRRQTLTTSTSTVQSTTTVSSVRFCRPHFDKNK